MEWTAETLALSVQTSTQLPHGSPESFDSEFHLLTHNHTTTVTAITSTATTSHHSHFDHHSVTTTIVNQFKT
jgi:hypothetical protein